MTESILKEMGDYLWIQLTECRHFGAFESAADAFKILCERLWDIDNDNLSPKNYLFQALNALNKTNGIFCLILFTTL